MKKNLLFLLTFLCLGVIAQAMPAKPGWHTVEQSDGTTLQVKAVGNAFNNALLTSDGLTVARGSDGDFYYISSATGLTTMRAHEADQRSASENAFINVQRGSLTMQYQSYIMPREKGNLGVGGSNADASVPAQGQRRIPIILVEFKDKKFNNTPQGIVDAMLTGNESVGQYFRDQSNGMYEPNFEVFGIYTLSQNREYYGGHQGSNSDKMLGAFVTEAVQLAAADGVSFKPYDTNSDDYCDVVIVIYAGVGEAQASWNHPEAIWPCNWDLTSAYYYSMGGTGAFRPKQGDPYVNNFAVFNELHGSNDNTTTIDGIGTFVHEFGHCLGLPDFYDTGSGDHYGLGDWDIMCMGCYNNDGFTPPGYSAYEKNFMGWIEFITPQPGTYYTLPVFNQKQLSTDKALCIMSNLNSNEFFIVENRKKQGWDRYAPGEGIM
ncbi:MAG: M6 family metalloprotease domain-containing protein, partial [Muribaculaceae bacterium]|nr:M6 family metalloprotease domain-containing protein [Muribaculaceae bacterium]